MAGIEVFADIVCPFTHVGLRRLNEARRTYSPTMSIRVRAWPLEWVNGAPLAADVAAHEIEALRAQVAPEMFAGFDPTAFPHTSIPALGLVAAAYAVNDGTGLAVSLAFRDELFEHGQDVSDGHVLEMVGRSFGVEPLPPAAAKAAVKADLERGKAQGVQGSPHFFVGDRGWFCPSLDIHHEGKRFVIRVDGDEMKEFYVAAFGEPAHA